MRSLTVKHTKKQEIWQTYLHSKKTQSRIAETYSWKHTHTHPFNGPFSGTTRVNQYQKGKSNEDFTEARDSEWQWHQLGHMQVCTLLQTDNHASTQPLSFLQAGCPSCCPTNCVKALKALFCYHHLTENKINKHTFFWYHQLLVQMMAKVVQLTTNTTLRY